MKSVDMVREGGLVAFITSQGVLNAEQGRPVREWLMNRCAVSYTHLDVYKRQVYTLTVWSL